MQRTAQFARPDTRFHPWVPARLQENRLVALLVRLDSRWRMRRGLARLSDHYLDDIGLTRTEAAGECAKPVWRA